MMCEESGSIPNTMDGHEMLKALYDFQAVYPKTISFDEGEYFILHQRKISTKNWWQVVNSKGDIGFVPSNYVMKIKVDPIFLLTFLTKAIAALKDSPNDVVNGVMKRDVLLVELADKKNDAEIEAKKMQPSSSNVKLGVARSCTEVKLDAVQSANGEPNIKFHSNPTISRIGKNDEIASKRCQENTIVESSETSAQIFNDDQVIPPNGQKSCTPPEPLDNTTTVMSVQSNFSLMNSASISSSELPECRLEVTQYDKPGTKDLVNLNDSQIYNIIDAIRQHTNLSHELSFVALKVSLSELSNIMPPDGRKYFQTVLNTLTEPVSAPDDLINSTHDSQRLRIIFSQLDECKNDSEQRTWMLYEDEVDIKYFLTELISILENADRKICIHEMAVDNYQCIINLVLYYQMETRWSIRLLLLSAFKTLSYLDPTATDVMLTSVLPMELIEDMKSNSSDVPKLRDITEMLTIILSSGQKIPVNHQDCLCSDFILFLMSLIEEPPETDHNEIIPDIMLNLILAINLQYDEPKENLVLEALQQLRTAKIFTEKILLLVNREDDPVNILPYSTQTVNSVLKMCNDLFSTPETAGLFYTSDSKVLIDILVRQLTDLSAGDPLRRWYLELCRKILRNTNYTEHGHRKQDLMKIFTRIFCEETESSAKDQQLVREIANEFPQHFKA